MKNTLERHTPTDKNEKKNKHDLLELIIQIMNYMIKSNNSRRLSVSSSDETLLNDVSLN